MHRKGKQYVNAQRAGEEITFASRGVTVYSGGEERKQEGASN